MLAEDVPEGDLEHEVGDGAVLLAQRSLLDDGLGLGHLVGGSLSATVLSGGVSDGSHTALAAVLLVALLRLDGLGVGVGNLNCSVHNGLFLNDTTWAETFDVLTGTLA